MAAYRSGNAWHKTLQVGENPLLADLSKRFGHLVTDHRKLGNWTSPDVLEVQEVMKFQRGEPVTLTYQLHFRPLGPVRMDRGGFEEGALGATNYRVEGS